LLPPRFTPGNGITRADVDRSPPVELDPHLAIQRFDYSASKDRRDASRHGLFVPEPDFIW